MAKKGVKLVGDWKGLTHTLKNLNGAIKTSGEEAIKQAALYAEGQAKRHMSMQDLGWRPLKPSTIASNVRKGESTNILIATSTYFQAITSVVRGKTAFAGIERTVKTRDGEVLADIAAVHEFGSRIRNIEARPLWGPVLKEVRSWLIREKLVQKGIKRKLRL